MDETVRAVAYVITEIRRERLFGAHKGGNRDESQIYKYSASQKKADWGLAIDAVAFAKLDSVIS
jgi:branched-subunit amino acid aminotransferase/4-amino-4-deoxychorismate lyase